MFIVNIENLRRVYELRRKMLLLAMKAGNTHDERRQSHYTQRAQAVNATLKLLGLPKTEQELKKGWENMSGINEIDKAFILMQEYQRLAEECASKGDVLGCYAYNEIAANHAVTLNGLRRVESIHVVEAGTRGGRADRVLKAVEARLVELRESHDRWKGNPNWSLNGGDATAECIELLENILETK